MDDALYYLGLIAERHEDLQRALRLYAEVQGGDDAVPALLRAATILRAHGAAPAAEDLLDRLIEEAPQRAPEIVAARARIYADAGDFSLANAVLESGELQYPDNVQLRYAKASLEEEQGRVAAALHELTLVSRMRPNDPAALNALGFTLADHNQRLKFARKLIERAYSAAPKNAAILDSLGWVMFRQGHDEQALSYLCAAYADDRGGDIAAHLGEVLWRVGRQADAERIWSEGGQVDVDNHLLKAHEASVARVELIVTVLHRLVVVLGCATLAACMTTRPPAAPPRTATAWEQRVFELSRLNTWQLDGRAAVALTQTGGATQGWQATLSWHENDAAADVHLSGPLGVGAVVLTQTSRGVSLNGAAPSDAVIAQIEARLGFTPPLDSLRFWLIGMPDPSTAFELARNEGDRAKHLAQSGWTIDYDRYMPFDGDVLPALVVLSREGIRVRIAVDHWSGLR